MQTSTIRTGFLVFTTCLVYGQTTAKPLAFTTGRVSGDRSRGLAGNVFQTCFRILLVFSRVLFGLVHN
jgi:hypothetical protein